MMPRGVPLGRVGDADLKLLRLFKVVADCGGLSAAESELNIAMSTISRHVSDLEDRLGLVLCRRGRGGFSLTPEGQSIYLAAEQLFRATDAFRATLHDIHRHMRGDLHLALFEKIPTNPQAKIAEAIALFRAQAPDVTIHIHSGSIAAIEREILAGQFQLGVMPTHRKHESLEYDELFDENMRLFVGRGHPWFSMPARKVDWDDLRQQPLAGLEYQSPNMTLAHTHRLRRAATASDEEAVAHLVLSGCYVGFLPDHYAAQFVQDGRMHAIGADLLRYNTPFHCVRRRGPPLTRVADAFCGALLKAHGKDDAGK